MLLYFHPCLRDLSLQPTNLHFGVLNTVQVSEDHFKRYLYFIFLLALYRWLRPINIVEYVEYSAIFENIYD